MKGLINGENFAFQNGLGLTMKIALKKHEMIAY